MRHRRPLLDPLDRGSEVLFGLIMVLTFTGTMSIAVEEGARVGAVVAAAFGCNLAWGIVDAVMYVVIAVAERARRASLIEAVRTSPLPEARRIFVEHLPANAGMVIDEDETEILLARLRALPAQPPEPLVQADDFRSAALVFFFVIAATFPPTLPFVLVDDLSIAIRVSNAIALVMLFLIGMRLGSHMGRSPWPMAIAMTALGTFLVVLTIALGG